MAFLSRKAMAATFKGVGLPSVVSTDAEGWWHADGLASATSWTNSGTTGTDLDIDTVVNSSANFSISKTLNGIACWDTGGTGGCLRTSGAPTYSIDATFFIVYQWQTVPTTYRFIYEGESTTTSVRNVYYYDQVSGTQHGFSGGITHGAGTLLPDGDIHCVQHDMLNSAGTDTIWQTVEGDQGTGGAHTSWRGLTIAGYPGGLYFADIKIGEMILFDRSVTAQEEKDIRKYLIAKWGTVGAWNDQIEDSYKQMDTNRRNTWQSLVQGKN